MILPTRGFCTVRINCGSSDAYKTVTKYRKQCVFTILDNFSAAEVLSLKPSATYRLIMIPLIIDFFLNNVMDILTKCHGHVIMSMTEQKGA